MKYYDRRTFNATTDYILNYLNTIPCEDFKNSDELKRKIYKDILNLTFDKFCE